MSTSDSSVKRVSNLPSTLGQKTMAGSASVVLASDQVIPVTMSSPGIYTGFHSLAHIDAGQWIAANLMASAKPLSGINGDSAINITNLLVSTDTALKLALHQSTLADYLLDMSVEPTSLWKLDEASGNAADSAGSATLTATATPTYAAESWVCSDGKAVQLNGSTQGFKTTTKLATASAGAFECWFWLDVTPGATMHIASAADAAAVNDYWRVSVTTARKVNFHINTTAGGGIQDVTSDFVHNLRQWYHLAVTYVGGVTRIYINGRLTATSLLLNTGWYDAVFSVVDNFVLGYMSSTTNTGWFQGKLALAAWYVNAATDDAWAKRQYQMGAPIFGPHQFAANGNLALSLGAPITLLNNHSVYVRSTASATATVELIGYDQ